MRRSEFCNSSYKWLQIVAPGHPLSLSALKAPEHWRTPRRFAWFESHRTTRRVLDCGGAPPLSLRRTAVSPDEPGNLGLNTTTPLELVLAPGHPPSQSALNLPPVSRFSHSPLKRQNTGALQDALRRSGVIGQDATFWTVAAVCDRRIRLYKSDAAHKSPCLSAVIDSRYSGVE